LTAERFAPLRASLVDGGTQAAAQTS
jgi:hypothetical protein